MRSAILDQAFSNHRADASFAGPRSSTTGAFRSTFESMLSERRDAAKPQDIDILQQDERTIRRPREAEPTRSEEGESAQPEARVERAEPATRSESGAEEKGNDESPAAKAPGEKPKPKKAKEDDEEAAAAAAGAVAGTGAAMIAEGEAAVVEGEQAGVVDAKAAKLEALVPALTPQAGAADAAGPKADTTALPKDAPKPKPGPELQDAIAEMEQVPEEAQAIVKAASGAKSEGESGDLLQQSPSEGSGPEKPAETKSAASTFTRELDALQSTAPQAPKAEGSAPRPAIMPTMTPEQKFVHDNVDQVVTSVRTQSLSGGGQMNVRLDPPELGVLQVAVKMVEGRLTASFTTSNEQATQLLSHSLQHLKSSLEASGVHVDRIEVRQAPQNESSNSKSQGDSQHQQQRGFDGQSQQSEQQRKEMVRRMWHKLAFGTDDLDLVA